MRAVLITGARGGIGSALCAAFDQAGFRVVATDLAGPLPLNSHAFVAANLETIVQDAGALESFAQEVRKACEGTKFSVLVNNAAVQVLGSLPNISTVDWERSFRVHVTTHFILVREFLSDLTMAEGTVINIGSVHAKATKQSFVAYAATKAALHGLTRSLAVDLGEKLRVITLAPAAIATPMQLWRLPIYWQPTAGTRMITGAMSCH